MQNVTADSEKLLREAKVERDALLKEAREIKESIISEAKEQAQVEGDKMIKQAQATKHKQASTRTTHKQASKQTSKGDLKMEAGISSKKVCNAYFVGQFEAKPYILSLWNRAESL